MTLKKTLKNNVLKNEEMFSFFKIIKKIAELTWKYFRNKKYTFVL